MNVLVVGIGALAREIVDLLVDNGSYKPNFFSEDLSKEMSVNGLAVDVYTGFEQIDEFDRDEWRVLVGVGNPAKRRDMYGKFEAKGFVFETYIADGAFCRGKIGAGCVIFPGVKLGLESEVKENSIVNYNCVVGHDTTIGRHSVLSPSVNLGGRVTGGDGVMYGIGCSAIEKVKVGNSATIAAGSSVYKDVPPGSTVYGTPAKVMEWRKNASK